MFLIIIQISNVFWSDLQYSFLFSDLVCNTLFCFLIWFAILFSVSDLFCNNLLWYFILFYYLSVLLCYPLSCIIILGYFVASVHVFISLQIYILYFLLYWSILMYSQWWGIIWFFFLTSNISKLHFVIVFFC